MGGGDARITALAAQTQEQEQACVWLLLSAPMGYDRLRGLGGQRDGRLQLAYGLAGLEWVSSRQVARRR